MEGLTIKTIGDLAIGRKNNLDIIRFVAAVMVMYSHSFPLSLGNNGNEILLSLTDGKWMMGQMGVAIFFIISGYLITQSYEYSNNIVSFVKSRILRIFPGLGAALLLSVLALGVLASTVPIFEYLRSAQTLQYLKSFFLYPMYWYLPGVFEENVYKGTINGSLWTIPFEVLCYVIVAILGLLGLLRYKKLILLVFFLNLFYLFYSSVISPAGGEQIIGLQLITLVELFAYFSAGMVIYTFRNQIPHDKHLAMMFILILLLSIYYTGFKEIFIFCGSYLVFYFAYSPRIKLSGFSKYGDFSYGIYIYAFPVQQYIIYLYGGTMNSYLNLAISFVVTLVLAVLSWYIVERNFLKLKSVKLHSYLIPSNMYTKVIERGFKPSIIRLKEIYIRILASIKIGWISFVVLVTLFGMLIMNYNEKPSIITFPYNESNSIFQGGWLPQSPDEDYRWVSGSASVAMSQSPDTATLVIEGFLPDTFVEVNNLVVSVDNRQVGQISVTPGQGITFASSIPNNESNKSKDITVLLQFNSTYKPAADSPDQREMSALISKIIIR